MLGDSRETPRLNLEFTQCMAEGRNVNCLSFAVEKKKRFADNRWASELNIRKVRM